MYRVQTWGPTLPQHPSSRGAFTLAPVAGSTGPHLGYWQHLSIHWFKRSNHCEKNLAPASDLLIAAALTADPPQPATVPTQAYSMSFLPFDARPYEHLQHLLLHALTQVVICATVDAKGTLGRGRCSGGAQVLAGHDTQGKKLDLIQRPSLQHICIHCGGRQIKRELNLRFHC